MPGLDGNDRKRSQLERLHADKLAKAFAKMRRLVVPAGTTPENISPDLAVERHRKNQSVIRDTLVDMLVDAASLGGKTGLAQVDWVQGTSKAAIGISWDMVNQAVLDWVLGSGRLMPMGRHDDGYVDSIMLALYMTSERQIRQSIGEWVSNGLPLHSLITQLERSVYSEQRAKIIAVTETTRAYAEGNRAAWRVSGVIERMRWQTSVDEMVCPVCRPLSGQIVEVTADGWQGESGVVFPPAHPRCRCWVTPVVA